ncbi:MAG TPA: carbohydrate ABC transporter permease [Chloroflexota bacterium]|jgi:multiple sugar transport system permease protein|nr:carbohydrate ABC transporter permease [Chloroflexota bacterium]
MASTTAAWATRRTARARASALVAQALKHAGLIALSAFFVLPWFWMLTTSLKTPAQMIEIPIRWIPDPVLWQNYPNAFFRDPNQPLLLYFQNTLTVALPSVIGALLSNTMVAYGFARLQWPGRNLVFMLVIATLLVPFPVVMIPLYLFWRFFELTNTYWPLVLPAWLASPYLVFLLRQFFMTIPQELSESARLDGASEMRILWQVIMPLARPALAVVALFEFIRQWNDFLGPLIFLNEKSKFTIALGLRNMQNAYGLSNFGEIMAASTITILPVVLIFFLAQRTFIQGITFTGIKG